MTKMYHWAIVPLLGASLLSGCSREAVAPTSTTAINAVADVQLVHNRVQFATVQSFERERTRLSKAQSTIEFDEWENKLGFTSLRRHAAMNEDGQAAILQQSFLFPLFHATLINEAGEFQVGETIFWYHDGFRYEASSEQELAAIKADPTVAKVKTTAGGVAQPLHSKANTPNTGIKTNRVQDNGDGVDTKYRYNYTSSSSGTITYGTVIYTERPIAGPPTTFVSDLYINLDIIPSRRGSNAPPDRVIDYALDLHAIAGYEHSYFYEDHNTELNNHIEQHAVMTNTLLQVQLGHALCYYNDNGGRTYTSNGVKWDYQLSGYITTNVTGVSPNVSYTAPASGNSLW